MDWDFESFGLFVSSLFFPLSRGVVVFKDHRGCLGGEVMGAEPVFSFPSVWVSSIL